MKSTLYLALVLLLSNGCWGWILPDRRSGVALYTDQQSGFSVRYDVVIQRGADVSSYYSRLSRGGGDRGEKGDLNPAVIEYVMTRPESPFTRYYDAALRIKKPPKSMVVDLQELRPVASQFASPPRGADFARALARRLAGHIRDATRRNGAATLFWGLPVDLDSGLIKLAFERGSKTMRTTLFRYQSSGMVVLYESGSTKELAWDLSQVPGAFDSTADLSFDEVAQEALAMHTTAVAR